MKKILFILTTVLTSSLAFAGPSIKQINKSSDQIAVQKTNETTIGSQWVVSEKSGSQCLFEVVQANSQSAVLETSDCDLAQIRVGQKIEKSLFSSADNQNTTSGKAPIWMKKLDGFSLIGFYSFSDELKYKANSQDYTGAAETSFGFGAEYKYSLVRPTGGLPLSLIGGLTYELSREQKSETVNNQTQNFQGTKPNFSLWLAYLNGQYDVNEWFGAFFGFNYSFPVESDYGNINLKSDLGYQLGASFSLSNNFAVDGLYRWVNIKANNGITDVSLDGLTIRGRYIF